MGMTDLIKSIPGVANVFYRHKYAGLPFPLCVLMPHSQLSLLNLLFLKELTRRIDEDRIEGDLVECGVYKGGSAGILAFGAMRSDAARHCWFFDSFEGMSKPSLHEQDPLSLSIKDTNVGSEENTRKILKELKVPSSQYAIVKGWFVETFPKNKIEKIALLHIDCDYYEPVKLTLEQYYDAVSPGGYVIFNDYGSFQGCRKAADDFLKMYPKTLIQIDQDAYFFRK